ncbi:hypothetical protein DFQ27_000209 [Actinomortierella ambigua]|uniref:Uncharacterized protein n=1 Tax=Actinomortierella ambigua TaxID=1343610 RepID=A0A9P6PP97_9FUNG|nr:hypothetical protein DFQ27_000209 [Actinomortierella ambigua]
MGLIHKALCVAAGNGFVYMATLDVSNNLYLLDSIHHPRNIAFVGFSTTGHMPLKNVPIRWSDDVSCSVGENGKFMIMALLKNTVDGRNSSQPSWFWGATTDIATFGNSDLGFEWDVMSLPFRCEASDTCSHQILPGYRPSFVHAVHQKSNDTTWLSTYDDKTFQNYTSFSATDMPFDRDGLVAYHKGDLIRMVLDPITNGTAPMSTRVSIQKFLTNHTGIPLAKTSPWTGSEVELPSACVVPGNRLGRQIGVDGDFVYIWCQDPVGDSMGKHEYNIYVYKEPGMSEGHDLLPVTKFNAFGAFFQTFLPFPMDPGALSTLPSSPWWFPSAILIRDGLVYSLNSARSPETYLTQPSPVEIDAIGFTYDPYAPDPSKQSYRPYKDSLFDKIERNPVEASLIIVFALIFLFLIIGFARRSREEAKRALQPPPPPFEEVVNDAAQQQRPASILSCDSLPKYTERPSSSDLPREANERHEGREEHGGHDEHEEHEMQPVRVHVVQPVH